MEKDFYPNEKEYEELEDTIEIVDWRDEEIDKLRSVKQNFITFKKNTWYYVRSILLGLLVGMIVGFLNYLVLR